MLRAGQGGAGRCRPPPTCPPAPYSLGVARGPGQAAGVLAEDEDGPGDVVGGALHLVRGQPQELGSAVGEAQGQLGAAAAAASPAVLAARAASHDAAHEIGHGGLDPGEHSTPGAPPRHGGAPAATPHRGGGAPGRAAPRSRAAPSRAEPSRVPQAQGRRGGGLMAAAGFPLPAGLSPVAAAAESCDGEAGFATALPAPPAAPPELPAGPRPPAGARRAGPGRAGPPTPGPPPGRATWGPRGPLPPANPEGSLRAPGAAVGAAGGCRGRGASPGARRVGDGEVLSAGPQPRRWRGHRAGGAGL